MTLRLFGCALEREVSEKDKKRKKKKKKGKS